MSAHSIEYGAPRKELLLLSPLAAVVKGLVARHPPVPIPFAIVEKEAFGKEGGFCMTAQRKLLSQM